MRLQRFYKEKMGITLDGSETVKDQLAATRTGELIGEVGVISKRIEFLEEQAEKRNKHVYGDNDVYKREIARLEEELNYEKSNRAVIISKKNAEIAYFKAELDALLGEIATSASSASKSSDPLESL